VGSSNVVRLRTTHGAITTTAITAITPSPWKRRFQSQPGASNAVSPPTSTSRITPSERVSAASDSGSATSAARPRPGASQNRYTARSAHTTRKQKSVSSPSTASFDQRAGAAAASAAATRPARSPAMRRPSRPISTMVPTPSSAVATRCWVTVSNPRADGTARNTV
jgi:hypothetical protein